MKLTLRVWRQKHASARGRFATYEARDISPDMSFLEMLDVVNEGLIRLGEDPIAFEHDCREGICGACGFMIDGVAHGPKRATTVCQLHMRSFADGAQIYVEPWRAKAFPVVKDLVCDRSAFDRIIQSGGFVNVNTGGAPDGNALPVPKVSADRAMDAAECIGCGACVAACPNASAMLFLSAKVSHLSNLPQGQVERKEREGAGAFRRDAIDTLLAGPTPQNALRTPCVGRRREEWEMLGSNQRLLPREDSALPLS